MYCKLPVTFGLYFDYSRYDYIADPGTGHTNAQVRL